MSIDRLTEKQLAKEVQNFRIYLEPIINLHYKEVLVEVERRLKRIELLQPDESNKRKPQQRKRMTKQERYLKYFYK